MKTQKDNLVTIEDPEGNRIYAILQSIKIDNVPACPICGNNVEWLYTSSYYFAGWHWGITLACRNHMYLFHKASWFYEDRVYVNDQWIDGFPFDKIRAVIIKEKCLDVIKDYYKNNPSETIERKWNKEIYD